MLVDPGARAAAEPADVIFVLGSGGADRWLEGYELWREGRAPLIVISGGLPDSGSLELARRGVRIPTGADIARDVLVGQLKVPARAVEILPGQPDNTAAEAEGIRALAQARGWRRVLVVTSIAHTRRARFAMDRALGPAGVAVQVRGSRYDTFESAQWWANRGSIRWILTELPKLAAYRLGVGE
jgi:uncharacterized SAM-binding protein YcdF (DUF218 family)